jgi:hypothetical protein
MREAAKRFWRNFSPPACDGDDGDLLMDFEAILMRHKCESQENED